MLIGESAAFSIGEINDCVLEVTAEDEAALLLVDGDP